MPDGFRFPRILGASYALARAAGKPATLRLTLTVDAGAKEDADALIDALDHPATVDATVHLLRHENGLLVDALTGEITGPIDPQQPPMDLPPNPPPRTEREAGR